jgi:hypothetical protein
MQQRKRVSTMMRLGSSLADLFLCLLVSSDCRGDDAASSGQQTVVQTESGETSSAGSIDNEAGVIRIADSLLAKVGLNWGRPTEVTMSATGYYRVQYGVDTRGAQRVVLVSLKNGLASFPLPLPPGRR